MNNAADLARRLDNLIRPGVVAHVDHAQALCRVRTGDLLTDWLPWLEPRAGTTRTWSPPTEGEQVLLLCPCGEVGAGWVLRAGYTAAHGQPSSSADTHVTDYPDGARVEYNHATSALIVSGIKTATVQASEHVTVDCPENTVTGNVLVQGALTVQGLLTYQNGMTGNGGSGGGGTAITGPFTHVEGPLSSNGVVLDTHVHGGVIAGGSDTDVPK